VVSCGVRFTPEERAPGTHCIGGWEGPRTGFDAVKRGKSLTLAGNRTSAVQPVSHRYTDSYSSIQVR
jgi:hypothetical protein